MEEQLRREPWYHGKMNRKEAEKLLKVNGDFLVRESTTTPGQYVLTGLQGGQPKHLLLVDPEGVVSPRRGLGMELGTAGGDPRGYENHQSIWVLHCSSGDNSRLSLGMERAWWSTGLRLQPQVCALPVPWGMVTGLTWALTAS